MKSHHHWRSALVGLVSSLLPAVVVGVMVVSSAQAQDRRQDHNQARVDLNLPPPPPIGTAPFAVAPILEAPTSACDRLAGRYGAGLDSADLAGINFGQIDPPPAIAACEAAIAAAPAELRYRYQLGRAQLAAGDAASARRTLTRAADGGHVRAMLALATILRNGRGGDHDLDGAYRWTDRAAAAGDPEALTALATLVRFGIATPLDLDRWISLLQRAAAAGSTTALRQLGIAYQDGIGVDKNTDIAADLFLSVVDHERPRADRGIADAIWTIGWAHEHGRGVPRDAAAALVWYRKGEALNDPDSIFAIGWFRDNGIAVPLDKTKACDAFERAAALASSGWMLNAAGWCYWSGAGRPRDDTKARVLFERAVASGDSFAPRNLARVYEEGRGVPRDKVRADALHRLAAERGNTQAMLEYGYRLRTQSSPRLAESCDWYESAARRGLPRAMNNLGACYTTDEAGRRKDLPTARAWYQRAADSGDGLALRNLGDMFMAGVGVAKDEARAVDYYRLGAAAGDAGAMVEYGVMLTRGFAAAPDPTAGCNWFEKAANAGESRAMNNLGACFANGDGRTIDVPAGIVWYEKAIAAGDSLAMVNLGELLLAARGVDRDVRRALDLFKRAADFGQAAGAAEYAAALFVGNGVPRDPVTACSWYEKAAHQDHPTGLNGLGVCYESGIGRKRDTKAAYNWFTKAADAGSLTALRNLVRYTDRGLSGPKNPEAAAAWFRKAVARGHQSLLNDLLSYPASWSRETRRALQRSLKRDGLYNGPIDGFLSSSIDATLWSALGPASNQRPRLVQEFTHAPLDGAPKGLLVRLCKAPGASTGRHPLVVINHGLTTDDAERRDMRPMSCGAIASFFVQRGYIVATPLRRGYGETGGRFSEGGTRVCATSPDFIAPGMAIAADIQATIAHLKQRDDVAAGSTIVLGHSGGGWGALALASRNTPDIAGFVNISGVHGSNRNRPEGVCGPDPITKSTQAFGRTARSPTLWIYAENDSHAGPRLVRRMFDGFQKAGGRGTLHVLPAYETDGHNIFDDDGFEVWGSLVDDWLKGLAVHQ